MTPAARSDRHRTLQVQDLERVLDALADGLVTLDDRGRVLGINRAAAAMLEAEQDEVLGADFLSLWGAEFRQSAPTVARAIADGEECPEAEARVVGRSGQERVLRFQVTPLDGPGGARQGSVVVVRDVTALARLKEDLVRRYRLPESGPKRKAIQAIFQLLESLADPDIAAPQGVHPETLRETLTACHWNMAEAARRLGVSRTALYKRIRAMKIQRPH